MLSNRRIWLARGIAVAADALQLAVFPVFSPGLVSPMDAVLDVVVAVLMTVLVGWHIAFLPTFFVEALPFADLAPTWTLAVLIATRRGGAKSAPRELGSSQPAQGAKD